MVPAFRAIARALYLRRGVCDLAPGRAATMWLPPGADETLALRAQVGIAARLLRLGRLRAISRASQADRALTAARPTEPFLLLSTVAVTPAGQGRGLGARLLAPALAAADARGWLTYLESSNPANRAFYERAGFRVDRVLRVASDAPPVELMIRRPSPPN